jgi:hypothetical protein
VLQGVLAPSPIGKRFYLVVVPIFAAILDRWDLYFFVLLFLYNEQVVFQKFHSKNVVFVSLLDDEKIVLVFFG